jgi:hypothetical protein
MELDDSRVMLRAGQLFDADVLKSAIEVVRNHSSSSWSLSDTLSAKAQKAKNMTTPIMTMPT